MSRITPTNLDESAPSIQNVLKTVRRKIGFVPNFYGVIAKSHATMKAYRSISDALSAGRLSPKLRERLAIAVAQANNCDYCLSVHTQIGAMLGLTPSELEESRSGRAQDPADAAALSLAMAVLNKQGQVSDADMMTARTAGLTDEDILEIVANVIFNLFSNYLNHVMQPAIDFPLVPATEDTKGQNSSPKP